MIKDTAKSQICPKANECDKRKCIHKTPHRRQDKSCSKTSRYCPACVLRVAPKASCLNCSERKHCDARKSTTCSYWAHDKEQEVNMTIAREVTITAPLGKSSLIVKFPRWEISIKSQSGSPALKNANVDVDFLLRVLAEATPQQVANLFEGIRIADKIALEGD